MANTTITKILCRRGPEADRNDITPTMGEPIWTTDTHRFYVGDGETLGARPVVDIDPRYLEFKEQGPTDSQPGQIPSTGSTKHNVISFASQMTGDFRTVGRVISFSSEDACGTSSATDGVYTLTSGAAIHSAGGISCEGSLHAGKDVVSFCTSDIKFKENVTNIDNPLDKVKCINGVTFDWNDQQQTYTGADTGLIAQEVEQLNLPGLCVNREDGTKAVKYERVIPLLVECIKELTEKVERLESRDES